MICPSCATENELGRKFCVECGTRLAAGCPNCGTSNPPGSKFCGECGTTLATGAAAASASTTTPTSTGAPDGVAGTERRRVSILFADLVGFTSLTDSRDAEEVRDLQDRYFAAARAIVERYGGTVEKFIGDAVMAVWGAPVGHEDDAERAVRAALDLTDAVSRLGIDETGPRLAARAAVMTGEAAVAIGAVGQGMVSGDLVNTASRLQSAAPVGAVLIDEATRRATESAIASEPAGEQELRGKQAPVEAWRALHVVAMRRGERRTDRLEPPFVGRDAEFRLLKDLLHASADERRARLVSITGIAGIGKSRLAWELEKYIDGIVATVYWHQGRSPAYGEGVTFWALAEIVRGRAGIAETDDPHAVRVKLAATLEEFVADEAERRTIAPHLEALLGLGGPEAEAETRFSAWRRFIEAIGARGPVVVVFEDLQWADMGLIDFIESLFEWSRSHPILVVTLARPELLERRPTWGAGLRNFTALHLEPLADAAMAQLLEGVAPGLPRGFMARIVKRAAGVPLFAVETIRMLVDEGRLVGEEGRFRVSGDVTELAVPDSLRGLLTARIDTLEPSERAVLQDAAVLGQSFTINSLDALTGRPAEELKRSLRALVQREILAIESDPRSPERGQYEFVQGLIREVAHDTLSKRERRARHLAAARYFETLDSEELAGVLASHYLDAYLATPEGPEADALAVQARIALRAAADRSSALGSYELALGHLEQALRVTADPGERAAILESAASAAVQAARFDAAELYGRQALDWYLGAGELLGAARSAVLVTQPYFGTGRTTEAIALLESTLAACAAAEGESDVIRVVAELARALWMENDPRALELVDRALGAAEPIVAVPIVAEALVTKAAVLESRGRPLEGLALLRGALELATSHRLTRTELRARNNLASQLGQDDPRAARDIAVEGRELSRRLGVRDSFLWATFLCYGFGFNLGEWDWVLELTDEIEAGDPRPLDLEAIHGMRATVAAYRGDRQQAAAEHSAAVTVRPEYSRPEFLANVHSENSELAALAGRLPEAYDEAMTAARLVPYVYASALAARWALWMGDRDRLEEAMVLVRGSVDRGRSVAALRQSLEAGQAALEGRRDDAIAAYREAAASMRELDLPFDLARCQMEYAILVPPDDPGAGAAADEARRILTRLGSTPLIERLDQGLAHWEGREASEAAGDSSQAASVLRES